MGMHDAMIQPPECSDANADQSNCGFPESAPIFFLAFFVLSGMLLLNICVAIILDNFGESASEGELPVTEVKQEAANIIRGMDMHAHGGKATFQETLSYS